MKDYPSSNWAVIDQSFSLDSSGQRSWISNIRDSSKIVSFNARLPQTSRGIYVGGTGNVFVMDFNGNVIPFISLAAGIVHPICPSRIMNDDSMRTTATLILVAY